MNKPTRREKAKAVFVSIGILVLVYMILIGFPFLPLIVKRVIAGIVILGLPPFAIGYVVYYIALGDIVKDK